MTYENNGSERAKRIEYSNQERFFMSPVPVRGFHSSFFQIGRFRFRFWYKTLRKIRFYEFGFYYFFFILFIDNDQIVLTCNTCKYQLRIRVVGPVSFTRVVVPNTASGHVESGEFVASPSGSRPAYSIREQIVVIRCSQSCTTHILLV